MRYLKSKDNFLNDSEFLKEVFENDITWGGSLLGRLINSTIRKAKIGYKYTKVSSIVKQVEDQINNLLAYYAATEEEKKRLSEIVSKFLIEEVYKVSNSKESVESKLEILLGNTSRESLIDTTIGEVEKTSIDGKDDLIIKLKNFKDDLLKLRGDLGLTEGGGEEDEDEVDNKGEKDMVKVFYMNSKSLLSSICKIHLDIKNNTVKFQSGTSGDGEKTDTSFSEERYKKLRTTNVKEIQFKIDMATKAVDIYTKKNNTERINFYNNEIKVYQSRLKQLSDKTKSNPAPKQSPDYDIKADKRAREEIVKLHKTESYGYLLEEIDANLRDQESQAKASWNKVVNAYNKSGIAKYIHYIESIIKIEGANKETIIKNKKSIMNIGRQVVINYDNIGRPISEHELISEQEGFTTSDVAKSISLFGRVLLAFSEDMGVLGSYETLKEIDKQEKTALERPYSQITNKSEREKEYNRISGNYPKAREVINEYIDARKEIDSVRMNDVSDEQIKKIDDIEKKLDDLDIPFLTADSIKNKIYKDGKNDYEAVRSQYLNEYSEENRYENKIKREFDEKRNRSDAGGAGNHIKLFINSFNEMKKAYPSIKKESSLMMRYQDFKMIREAQDDVEDNVTLDDDTTEVKPNEQAQESPETGSSEVTEEGDKVKKSWFKFFEKGEEKKWKVDEKQSKDLNQELENKQIEIDTQKIGDSNLDPIIRIVNLFGRAYDLYATDYIPSGRPEGRVSQKTLREYENIGKGGNPSSSGRDAFTPGYGPWAAKPVYNKWQDGITKILENKQYRRILANTKFVSEAEKSTDTQMKKPGSGKTLFTFINDLLDNNEGTFKKHRKVIFEKYFMTDPSGNKDESKSIGEGNKTPSIKEEDKGDTDKPYFYDESVKITTGLLSLGKGLLNSMVKVTSGDEIYIIYPFKYDNDSILFRYQVCTKNNPRQSIVSDYLKSQKIKSYEAKGKPYNMEYIEKEIPYVRDQTIGIGYVDLKDRDNKFSNGNVFKFRSIPIKDAVEKKYNVAKSVSKKITDIKYLVVPVNDEKGKQKVEIIKFSSVKINNSEDRELNPKINGETINGIK